MIEESRPKPSIWLRLIYPVETLDDTDTIVMEYKAGLIVLLALLCAFCSFYYSFHDDLLHRLIGIVLTVVFLGVPVLMRRTGQWKLCGSIVCFAWLIDNNLVARCSIHDALALTFFQSLIPSYLLLASEQYVSALGLSLLALFISLPFEHNLVSSHISQLDPIEAKAFTLELLETTNRLNSGHLIATFCLTIWMSICYSKEKEVIRILLHRAEQSKRATEAFFAAVNHEFRSPLNTLLGSLDLLTEEIGPVVSSDSSSLLKTALDCGEILCNLINNVLDVSKITAEMFTPAVTVVQPRAILHKILNIGKAQALPKGIKIELTIDKGLPKSLHMDGLRFTQILMNLVSNAIKFTHEGAVKIHAKWVPEVESIPSRFREKRPYVETGTDGLTGNYVCYWPVDDPESELESESEELTCIHTWEMTEHKHETLYKHPTRGTYVKDMLCQTTESHAAQPVQPPKLQQNYACLPGEQVLIEYTYETRGEIIVSIEDSGIGISESGLKKLFNPFQQANDTVSKNYGGTGLGLWISRTISEVYDGSITVTSTEGVGSTFTVKLPCKVNTEDAQPEERTQVPGMKCLFIGYAKVSCEALRKIGVDIETVDTPSEALRRYKESRGRSFDIIILSQSDMTNVNLAKKLREVEKNFGQETFTPIFMLISTASRERLASVPCEINGYLTAPIKKSEVLPVLKALNKKKQAVIKRKVLLVDDDKFVAQIIGTILDKEGIVYVPITLAEEAVNYYTSHPEMVSLILLDTHLPDITGYEAATRIRQFEAANQLTEVPIISLSGMTGPKHESHCKASGYTAIRKIYIVTKPVRSNMLLKTIKPYFV